MISGQGKAGKGGKYGIELLTCSEAVCVLHVFKDYSKYLTYFRLFVTRCI
jgi:hypothetical protein